MRLILVNKSPLNSGNSVSSCPSGETLIVFPITKVKSATNTMSYQMHLYRIPVDTSLGQFFFQLRQVRQ